MNKEYKDEECYCYCHDSNSVKACGECCDKDNYGWKKKKEETQGNTNLYGFRNDIGWIGTYSQPIIERPRAPRPGPVSNPIIHYNIGGHEHIRTRNSESTSFCCDCCDDEEEISWRGNNGLNYSVAECGVDMEPIMEQPRFETTSYYVTSDNCNSYYNSENIGGGYCGADYGGGDHGVGDSAGGCDYGGGNSGGCDYGGGNSGSCDYGGGDTGCCDSGGGDTGGGCDDSGGGDCGGGGD